MDSLPERSPEADRPPQPIPGAAVLVWCVWGLLTLGLLWFVGNYGSNIPFNDEYNLVPLLTGAEPVTLSRLCQQNNEHRLPLPVALYLSSFKLAGNDFRGVMVLNAVSLSVLALAMTLVAKGLRGYPCYADAFFPLVLLHWAHFQNLLCAFEIQFISSTVLAGILLLVICRHGSRPPSGAVVLAGVCLAGLALCGMNGLALVPVLALWLAYTALARWRSRQPGWRRPGLLALAFGLGSILLVGLILLTYERPPLWYVPGETGLRDHLRTALQVFTLCLGFSVPKSIWPFSGVFVLGLLALGGFGLAVIWGKQAQDRPRAVGLLLFLAGMLCLALGIGWGRAGAGHWAGFQARYVTLLVPALCCVYFIWVIAKTSVSPLVQAGLFLVTCGLLVPNVQDGITHGGRVREQMTAVERALRRGTPASILAGYDAFLCPWASPEELAAFFQMLHRSGVGPFRFLGEDSPLREASFPVEPVNRSQGFGVAPCLTFALKEPHFVSAVRLTCSYRDVTGDFVLFRMCWKGPGQKDFSEAKAAHLTLGESLFRPVDLELRDKTVTIWVNDVIDRFRIFPDTKPCCFEVSEIAFLVQFG